jgi:hypothetical protein
MRAQGMSEIVDLAVFDPIFIVGAPRSGTTLLRAMLSRHPRIGLSDETYYLYTVYRRCSSFGDLANPVNRKALIESYTATNRVQQLNIDITRLKDRLMAEGTSYPAFFASFLQFYAEAQGKLRAGEKTPHHAKYVDTLLEWYPNSRVIHLVRDARDVCASLGNMPWGRKAAVANAKLWADLTLAAERGQGNPRFRRVRYEDLVANPEPTLRDLCDFVGEEYDPAMLGTTPVSTADKPWFLRSREALSKERMGLWQRRLSRNDVDLIETVAGPVMVSMGYDLNGRPASTALRLRGRVYSIVEDLKKKFLLAPRVWYSRFQPKNLVGLERWTDR